MKKNLAVKISVLIVGALVLIGITYLVTYRTTLNRLSIKTITPTQAAQAMKNDNFYSNYNESTLLIKGVVSSVSKQPNNLTISLGNSSTYETKCSMQNTLANITKGENITVVTVGAIAERESNAVLLKNCVLT